MRHAPRLLRITLHLNHAQDHAVIRRAADTGKFDSIMVDCIAVEAERGRIEGGEDGIGDTADLAGLLTTAAEAREFVDTAIDWLAPAVGYVHGSYGARGIVLEYDRLAAIDKAVGHEVRVVMHGTDGWDENIFGRCIEHGATKINVNKAVNKRYMDLQREWNLGITGLMEKGTEVMQEAVEESTDWLESSGKA